MKTAAEQGTESFHRATLHAIWRCMLLCSSSGRLQAARATWQGAASSSGSARQQAGRQRCIMPLSSAHKAPTSSEADKLMEALAIPPAPGYRNLGARVEHVLAPRDGPLAELVTEALQLPQGAAQLLLSFGAIHTCPVSPAMPLAILANMTPEQAARVQRMRQEALRRTGNSSQAHTPQRATQGTTVTQSTYIRVHLHPKRFPAAYLVDWTGRIVTINAEFAVVSKPAGVPSTPTVDNWLECAPACATKALGLAQPLLVTHRLDQCTEGLLVLGRTKAFVARFNELVQRSSSKNGGGGRGANDGINSNGSGEGVQQQAVSMGGTEPRLLRKFYRAATTKPPPLGLLRHYLSIKRRQQGLPCFTIAHEQAVEGSLSAELQVLVVQPIRLSARAAAQWGTDTAHECLIELLTGRTHQIRAQLAAVACPLLGDSLYQPLASQGLRQRLFAGDPCHDLRDSMAAGRLLDEPEGGIGLQACKLLVADACMGGSAEQPAVFEAGTPWWRAQPRI